MQRLTRVSARERKALKAAAQERAQQAIALVYTKVRHKQLGNQRAGAIVLELLTREWGRP